MKGKIQAEFRKSQHIHRLEINRIEYLLRIGKNKFAMIKESNITGIS